MRKIAAKYREQSDRRLTKEEGREWLTGAITRMKAQGAKGLRATAADDDEEGRLMYLVEGWDVTPGSHEWPDPVFDRETGKGQRTDR